MGAYAIYSNKPFRTNGKIQTRRKRGRIDDLMELIKDSHIVIDEKNQTFDIIKNDVTKNENK